MRRLALALLFFLDIGGAAGQGTVLSTEVYASLGAADRTAHVRVEYVVTGVEPGVELPASILTFGKAAPTGLRVTVGGAVVRFTPGPGRSQVAYLPVVVGSSGEGRVVAHYTVPSAVYEQGDALRGHIPVLALDLVHAEARPGFFRAELSLESDWVVSEVFPTGLAPVGDVVGSEQRYTVELPVVPATLSFRAHVDGRWHPGLPFVLDVLAAVIILGFGFVGWRHLQEEMA